MNKGWYVIHVYSGHENKVEKQLKKLMQTKPIGEYIFDIKVPSEYVVEIKNGKKQVNTKKFLPGYILVEMNMPNSGWKEICTYIRRVPGVTGFVGFKRDQKPQPIPPEDARAILQKSGEIKQDKLMKPKQSFSIGETVRIIDGPFNQFTGNVEEVNTEKGKLRVMVGIFGRSTPVEVDFLQVEKV